MAHYIRSGNTFKVAKKEALDISDSLPPGNYTVGQNPMTGEYFLEGIDSFAAPSKIYGDCLRHTNRIVTTFLSRPAATGVMLTGEKGSGKTLLTKNVAIELAKLNIPTLVINSPLHGDAFNSFLQSIDTPCAILFDEFEKVYDAEEQEAILTLLDGVFPSKKLFLLTANDKWRVDQHMRNRPGRIYYLIDFQGLGGEFITEYCEDNLKADLQSHIPAICTISGLFGEFNFDMLKGLVEEMNRYGEDPHTAMELLNAKPEFSDGSAFTVTFNRTDREIVKLETTEFRGNPLGRSGVTVEYRYKDEDGDSAWDCESMKTESLVRLDALSGTFEFSDGVSSVTLTRIREKTLDYRAF